LLSIIIVQSLGKLEKAYWQKRNEAEHTGGNSDHENKLHILRPQVDRPNVYHAWLRPGMRIEIKSETGTLTFLYSGHSERTALQKRSKSDKPSRKAGCAT
jgi:hypothetical protein